MRKYNRVYYCQASPLSLAVRVRDTDWGYDPRIPYVSVWFAPRTGFVPLRYGDYMPYVNYFGVGRD